MTVEVFDVTLREGEQSPGVVFSESQKLQIAHDLDAAGVPRIEAGLIGLSAAEDRTLASLARLNLPAARLTVAALMRREHLERARDVGFTCVSLIVPISDPAAQAILGCSAADAVGRAADLIAWASTNGLETTAALVDASRTAAGELSSRAAALVAASANGLIYCDSAGVLSPSRTATAVAALRQSTGPAVRLVAHLHNDFGLATANALAAAEAGVDSVQVTVNGIGERAGITPMAEFVAACELLFGISTGIRLDLLHPLARSIELASGLIDRPYAPVTGIGAFWCETGIPASTLQSTDSPFIPLIARPLARAIDLSFGKHSGRKSLAAGLGPAVDRLTPDALHRLVDQVKAAGESRSAAAATSLAHSIAAYYRELTARRLAKADVSALLPKE